MPSTRVTITIPVDLHYRIEAARGDVSRSRWIQRAIETSLRPDRTSQARPAATRGVRDTWAR